MSARCRTHWEGKPPFFSESFKALKDELDMVLICRSNTVHAADHEHTFGVIRNSTFANEAIRSTKKKENRS
jgi:hypothetical protein